MRTWAQRSELEKALADALEALEAWERWFRQGEKAPLWRSSVAIRDVKRLRSA
ncbi:hypothetical protein LCGC14_2926280 [marine sediment metagenome]|uniref:Uncharacterized protein n=1 Tax=marine sediment metagenome TaxID=412755 RepID=A0A0F9ADB5_9ZZZZ